MRPRCSSLLAALALAITPVAACTSDPAGLAPLLTRQTPEPPGAACADGGTAIQIGHDQDGDGVLDDAEVERSDYLCTGAPPATRVRETPVPSGAECPAGGTRVEVGIDDDRDGVLDDAEVESATVVCERDAIWEGDFAGDPGELAGIRVVTGAVHLGPSAAIDLPELELVGGDLRLIGGTLAVELPALRTIGGTLSLATPQVTRVTLSRLERIHGDVVVEATGDAATIAAPALRAIGGRLQLDWATWVSLAMPALETVGGDVALAGAVADLELTSLTAIAGDLRIDPTRLAVLSLPALQRIAGELTATSQPDLTTIDLPRLRAAGAVSLRDLGALTALLGALATVTSSLSVERVPTLTGLELPALEGLAG